MDGLSGGSFRMKIIDITDENKDLFSICLEDWSDDAKEAGWRRAQWKPESWLA
jgi:hypothetical protein